MRRQTYSGQLRLLQLTYGPPGSDGVACTIVLDSRSANESSVSLRFHGVRELEFRQSGFGNMFVELNIVDIRDRQLEGLNFEVVDEAWQSISFVARTLQVA